MADASHLGEALDALDAEREQLLALQLRAHPVLRRLQVPPAPLAPQDGHLRTTLDRIMRLPQEHATQADYSVGRGCADSNASRITPEAQKDSLRIILQIHAGQQVSLETQRLHRWQSPVSARPL